MNGSFAGMLPYVALLSKMYFWNDQDAVLLVAFSHTVLDFRNWYSYHHDSGWLLGSWIKWGIFSLLISSDKDALLVFE